MYFKMEQFKKNIKEYKVKYVYVLFNTTKDFLGESRSVLKVSDGADLYFPQVCFHLTFMNIRCTVCAGLFSINGYIISQNKRAVLYREEPA